MKEVYAQVFAFDKNSGDSMLRAVIEDKEFFKLNLQNPFYVDSLEYW